MIIDVQREGCAAFRTNADQQRIRVALYKKALELDPGDATNTGNYALFLADQRKDYDAAEALYKKALELDPSHANNTGNYAAFLAHQRNDYDAAEALYKKALALDPSDANHTGNYAHFLAARRKDYDAAEALHKKALALQPNSPGQLANFASLKLSKGDPGYLEQVHSLVRQVITLCRPDASQTLAEALLYGALAHELAAAEPDDGMLARLKALLALGFERGSWDFEPLFSVVLPRLPSVRQTFYRALGSAVLDGSKVASLAAFGEWLLLESKDPFAPFDAP